MGFPLLGQLLYFIIGMNMITADGGFGVLTTQTPQI